MDMDKIAGADRDRAAETSSPPRPAKRRHSASFDGFGMGGGGGGPGGQQDGAGGVFGEVMEAKKAMSSEQLAELAAIDPKRAKRILANRQSAARSKERKARYITELERKVQTLQTEATTLSAQLTLFQRDTTGLSAENAELKIRLQAMEQQAQLRDALNDALKQEVERLKIATGEMTKSNEAYNVGMQHVTYSPSFFHLSEEQAIQRHGNIQLPPHFQPPPNVPTHQMLSHPNSLSDMMQQESLGRFQGLDIGKGPVAVKSEAEVVVKSEGSSISAGRGDLEADEEEEEEEEEDGENEEDEEYVPDATPMGSGTPTSGSRKRGSSCSTTGASLAKKSKSLIVRFLGNLVRTTNKAAEDRISMMQRMQEEKLQRLQARSEEKQAQDLEMLKQMMEQGKKDGIRPGSREYIALTEIFKDIFHRQSWWWCGSAQGRVDFIRNWMAMKMAMKKRR